MPVSGAVEVLRCNGHRARLANRHGVRQSKIEAAGRGTGPWRPPGQAAFRGQRGAA
jgi:hypothetical protein